MKKLLFLFSAGTFFFLSCVSNLDNDPDKDDSGNSDTDTPVVDGQRITRVDLNYSNAEPDILCFLGYDSDDLLDRVTFVLTDGVGGDNSPYRLDYSITRNSGSLDFGLGYSETVYSSESLLSQYSGIGYPVSYNTFSKNIIASVNNEGNIDAVNGFENEDVVIPDSRSSYDENGNLLSLENGDGSDFTLEWDDEGNISRYHWSDAEGNIADIDFTYTDYSSPDLGLYLQILLFEEEMRENTVFHLFYGNSPENLPASVIISDQDGQYAQKDITYEFSGDRLSSMNVEAVEAGYSYSYSLDFHYDSQNPESIPMTPILKSQKIISDETLSSSWDNNIFTANRRLVWDNSYSDGSTTQDSFEYVVEYGAAGDWSVSTDSDNFVYYLPMLAKPEHEIEFLSPVYNPDTGIYTIPVRISFELSEERGLHQSIECNAGINVDMSLSYIINGDRFDELPVNYLQSDGTYAEYELKYDLLDTPEFSFDAVWLEGNYEMVDDVTVRFIQPLVFENGSDSREIELQFTFAQPYSISSIERLDSYYNEGTYTEDGTYNDDATVSLVYDLTFDSPEAASFIFGQADDYGVFIQDGSQTVFESFKDAGSESNLEILEEAANFVCDYKSLTARSESDIRIGTYIEKNGVVSYYFSDENSPELLYDSKPQMIIYDLQSKMEHLEDTDTTSDTDRMITYAFKIQIGGSLFIRNIWEHYPSDFWTEDSWGTLNDRSLSDFVEYDVPEYWYYSNDASSDWSGEIRYYLELNDETILEVPQYLLCDFESVSLSSEVQFDKSRMRSVSPVKDRILPYRSGPARESISKDKRMTNEAVVSKYRNNR